MAKVKQITAPQIRKIHALKGALGLADHEYQAILGRYGVESCKALDREEAAQLITYMVQLGMEAGVWQERKPEPKRHEELKGRGPDMATPTQLRTIEALWGEFSRAEGSEAKEKTLRQFLENKFKVSHLRFLSRAKASKIIYALERMQSKERRKALKAEIKAALGSGQP